MAKGRKLTASWSERLLSSYSYSSSHETFNDGELELGEDDVWSTVDEMVNEDRHVVNGSPAEWSPLAVVESNGSFNSFRSRRLVSRTENHRLQFGGLSLAFDDSGETTPSSAVCQFSGQQDGVIASTNRRHLATSAPVNVPDWSKIHRVNSVESFHDSDFSCHYKMFPPHEYLAREYERTGKTAANSMFEGVGRTLKGRDMSRVRDAVWNQTGFDG